MQSIQATIEHARCQQNEVAMILETVITMQGLSKSIEINEKLSHM